MSLENVLWMTFLFTVMVSDVADITLNGQGVFGSDFLSSSFAMLPDLVLCAGGLSAKRSCPGYNSGVRRTILSKLC